jgi:CheY-like chemotaxis protein
VGPGTEDETRPKMKTILLVEDALAVRTLTGNALKNCGYHVVEADSVAAALELWRKFQEKIDLVLADIVMPGDMTGLELVKTLQAEKPALRAVYMSGYSATLAGQRGELRDGINFLQKPFFPQKLADIVQAALNQ